MELNQLARVFERPRETAETVTASAKLIDETDGKGLVAEGSLRWARETMEW
jgi:hypothetical protein